MSSHINSESRLSRRAWLRSAGAGLAVVATGCEAFRPGEPGTEHAAFRPQSGAKPARPMPRIDTHVRLFAQDEAKFPFHENAPYTPDHRAPVERYLEHMDAAGIQGAVLVQPEPYQDDHRYVLRCLEQAPKKFRATCMFDPNASASLAAMMELCARPGFVALQIDAIHENRMPEFDSPVLRDMWQTAGQLGLAIELNSMPKHLPKFVPLIEAFPRVPIVVDHLGRPGQGSDDERSGILRLSALPNVYLKFSGLAMASKVPFPHADLKPFLEGIVDLFGPRRMMWGGNYQGEPYGDSAQAVDLLLDFVDARDRSIIAGGTADRLFHFG